MKIRPAFVFVLLALPAILLVGACEKHPVSDLQKVDPSAPTSPAPQ